MFTHNHREHVQKIEHLSNRRRTRSHDLSLSLYPTVRTYNQGEIRLSDKKSATVRTKIRTIRPVKLSQTIEHKIRTFRPNKNTKLGLPAQSKKNQDYLFQQLLTLRRLIRSPKTLHFLLNINIYSSLLWPKYTYVKPINDLLVDTCFEPLIIRVTL